MSGLISSVTLEDDEEDRTEADETVNRDKFPRAPTKAELHHRNNAKKHRVPKFTEGGFYVYKPGDTEYEWNKFRVKDDKEPSAEESPRGLNEQSIEHNCTKYPLDVYEATYRGGNMVLKPFEKNVAYNVIRTLQKPPTGDPEVIIADAEEDLDRLCEELRMKRPSEMRNGERPGDGTRMPFIEWFDSLPGNYTWAALYSSLGADEVANVNTILMNAAFGIYSRFRELMWRCSVAKARLAPDDDENRLNVNMFYKDVEGLYVMFRSQYVQMPCIMMNSFNCIAQSAMTATPYNPLIPVDLYEDAYDLSNPDNHGRINELLRMKDLLRNLSKKRELRRVGTDVYEPRYINSLFTYSYKLMEPVKSWVMGTIRMLGRAEYEMFEGKKGNAADIIRYFEERGGLRELKITRLMLSFRNGIYIVPQERFVLYQDVTCNMLPFDDVNSVNFFDYDFVPHPWLRDVELPFPGPFFKGQKRPVRDGTAYDIPTPTLDKIMHDQRWSYEVRCMMYVQLGRMLYDTKFYDDWQTAMFLLGRRATGKSTLVDLVTKFFGRDLTATMKTTGERVFGLMGTLDKFILAIPEVRGDWNLDVTDFLKMSAADRVAVPVKNSHQREVTFRSPIIMAGNEVMGWNDDSAAISRRLVIFYFNQQIKPDGTMQKKLDAELPNIILKINRYYIAAASRYEKGKIEFPKYFTKHRLNYLAKTSAIYQYLQNRLYEVPSDKFVPLDEIIRQFKLEFSKQNRGAAYQDKKKITTSTDVWTVACEVCGITISSDKEFLTRDYKGTSYTCQMVYGRAFVADRERDADVIE